MKKLLAIILAVLTMLSALSMVACNEEADNSGTQDTSNILFNGFEQFERDFLTMRVVDHAFGSVNICRDKNFVKFGEASALFRPRGTYHGTGKPIIYLPLYSDRFEYDYTDITKFEKISAWFYNAQEEPFRVGMGLQTATISCNQTLDSTSRTVAKSFDLLPGWNYVEYDLDPKYLDCTTTLDRSHAYGMFIQFEYVDPFRTEESPYIYCDDIRIHTSETAVQGSSTFGLKADAEAGVWEVANFEDERQLQFFNIASNVVETRRATLEVVNASEVNTSATSGSNVLKATLRSSYAANHSCTFTLSGQVLREVFATIGSDIIEHPENYSLCYDYFIASAESPGTFRGSLKSAACTSGIPSWACPAQASVDPYTWGTYEINIGWIDQNTQKYLHMLPYKSTYPKLKDGYIDDQALVSLNPDTLTFIVPGLQPGAKDINYVIDNIRIVRLNNATA